MLTDHFIALSECDTTIFDNNIIPFLQTYIIFQLLLATINSYFYINS